MDKKWKEITSIIVAMALVVIASVAWAMGLQNAFIVFLFFLGSLRLAMHYGAFDERRRNRQD